jgi:hypothetical protein
MSQDKTTDDAHVVLRLKVERSPSTGWFYVTSDEPRGLLLSEASLAEALAKVPQALADLRAAGGMLPLLEGVTLP